MKFARHHGCFSGIHFNPVVRLQGVGKIYRQTIGQNMACFRMWHPQCFNGILYTGMTGKRVTNEPVPLLRRQQIVQAVVKTEFGGMGFHRKKTTMIRVIIHALQFRR